MGPNLSASPRSNELLNKIPVLSMQPQSLNELIVFLISPPSIVDVSKRARLPVVAFLSVFSLAHLPLRFTLIDALLVEELRVETLIFLIRGVSLNFLI